jgi:hypothetical protein
MSQDRSYFVDSGPVSIAATTATPALYFTPAQDLNVVGVRASVSSAAGAPPSNTSILCALAIVTGTQGGGGAVTPRPTGQSQYAATSTWESATSAALTGLTEGAVLWDIDIPYSAGGSWGEWFPQGFERNCPNGTKMCFYFTAGSAGSGCSLAFRVDFTE